MLKSDVKEAIIKDFKKALMLPDNEYSMLPDRKTTVNAKEEILRLIFSKKEIHRFKNEMKVYGIPRAIREIEDFEKMLHEVGNYNLFWEEDSIEEAYKLYVDDFKDEKRDSFVKLAERAVYVAKHPGKVRDESAVRLDISLLSLDSAIKIVSENENNKDDYFNECKFAVGKTYKMKELGDGFMLRDEKDSYYHISDIELYYNLEIV